MTPRLARNHMRRLVCRTCDAPLALESSSDSLTDVVALRARVAALERILGQHLRMPAEFELTGHEEAIVLALYKQQQITNPGLWEILYGHLPIADQPTSKVIDVMMHHIRKKIGRLPHCLVIETVWGEGFRMTTASREKLREMIIEPDYPTEITDEPSRSASTATSI